MGCVVESVLTLTLSYTDSSGCLAAPKRGLRPPTQVSQRPVHLLMRPLQLWRLLTWNSRLAWVRRVGWGPTQRPEQKPHHLTENS